MWGGRCVCHGHIPQKAQNQNPFQKLIHLVFFQLENVTLSPRELGWIFKSVPVGTVILEIYPSIPLGQGLSSFALQLEKQDAVTVLKY